MSKKLYFFGGIVFLGGLLIFIAPHIPYQTEKSEKFLAELGNASAQFRLGNQFFNGGVVPKNCELAVYWYKKSAQNNNADASCWLGRLYLKGICVKKNDQTSFEYFKKSAELNDANGLNNLGVSYAQGLGAKKNTQQAAQCFKKSAEQEWSEAQFNLGVCYTFGIYVTKDLKIAEKYFEKSAHRGIHKKFSQPVMDRAKRILKSEKSSSEKPAFVRNWADEGV